MFIIIASAATAVCHSVIKCIRKRGGVDHCNNNSSSSSSLATIWQIAVQVSNNVNGTMTQLLSSSSYNDDDDDDSWRGHCVGFIHRPFFFTFFLLSSCVNQSEKEKTRAFSHKGLVAKDVRKGKREGRSKAKFTVPLVAFGCTSTH